MVCVIYYLYIKLIIVKLSHLETAYNFKSIFSNIEDPRNDTNKLLRLKELLLIGIIIAICNSETLKDR